MSEYISRTVTPDDLARLKADREAADAAYNAALTGVDQSLQQVPALPHPPPGPDEHQITPLNESWDILRAAPGQASGWRGLLTRFIWRVVEPVAGAQQRFNSVLVDHVNRNLEREREVSRAIESAIGLARNNIDESIRFQSHLISYLQSITPFVDTKDYEFAALTRRTVEDVSNTVGRLEEVNRGVAAGLSGLSDVILKWSQSMLLRDERYAVQLQELRTAVSTLQHTTLALKLELARTGSAVAADAAPATAAPAIAGPDGAALAADGRGLLAHDPLRSHQYAGFEDLFRGSEVEIASRLSDYVPIFAAASDVLDVGCGRGEMLELLRDAGVSARGVDLNHEMVRRCRDKGFAVTQADGLSYLRSSGPASLGGLIATQVVEHLQPDYLIRFLEAAADALRPGAPIVLETINPACWSAFFDSYLRDLTHVQPVHPDTLKYLVTAAGFNEATIQWRSPYPDSGKLERIPDAVRAAAAADLTLAPLITTVDRNADRLNALFFGHRDFAVVARRP